MDNPDKLIISRLGEHQRKLDFIVRCERDEKCDNVHGEKSGNSGGKRHIPSVFRKTMYALISAAACAVVFLIVYPMLKSGSLSEMQLPQPALSEYRGAGMSRLSLLMEEKKYEEALQLTDVELFALDSEISEIAGPDASIEEKRYAEALYGASREDLLWCKIYILTRLEKENDLKICCEEYLHNSDYETYKDDVEKIMKKMQ